MLNPMRWWALFLAPSGGGTGVSPPAANDPDEEAESDELSRQLADGELLARHALRARLAVAAEDIVLLSGARAQRGALRQDEAKQALFVAALRRVAAAVPPTTAELHALEQRRRRLATELGYARHLLYFAASQGRAVDDALAQPILAAVAGNDGDGVSEAQEQAFLVAYRRLAADMAPVTGTTLEASRQRIPKLVDIVLNPRRFVQDLGHITLGRFVHFVLFTLVLLCAGAAISYQTVGEAAFTRHKDVGTRRDELQAEAVRALAEQRDRQRELFALTERKDARRDDVALAGVKLQTAMNNLQGIEQRIEDAAAERTRLTSMLKNWAGQPCRLASLQWICRFTLNDGAQQPSDSEIVFDAEMALKRLNVIVLPMLLGLLGAYAYVLRTISREIRERCFSEHSALHHVVRLSLGALAGVAVGWFLKPEQIGLLSSVPAWVMAFVAGYGIELLFAFLDRIVAAFTSKQSGTATG
jgi:hypothetical protein